jgi:hypothetical protein
MKPSRTLEAAKLGLITLIALAFELLICLWLRPDAIAAISEVVGTLAIATACIATGGTAAIGGRHWGAKEASSSSKRPNPEESSL